MLKPRISFEFSPGKYEILLSFVGVGSRAARVKLYVVQEGVMQCTYASSRRFTVHAVQVYTHLGTRAHCKGILNPEAKARVGDAGAAHRSHAGIKRRDGVRHSALST